MPFAPTLTILLLAGPVIAGLAGTLLPALSVWPGLLGAAPSTPPFQSLISWPGLARATWLSFSTGFAATVISLIITALVLAGWSGTRSFIWLHRALSPLLAVPHAAAAFGIAFLIAPSGVLLRFLSPWLTGFDTPPDWLVLNDPNGLALILGLVAKEVPFLLLMSLAALPQTAPRRSLLAARALGYGRVSGWMLAIFPRLYRQIRLPLLAVLAYSASVVDMAIILGPSTPPTLAVKITTWISDPALSGRFIGAAAAVLQLGLVLASILLWWLGERFYAIVFHWKTSQGARQHYEVMWRALGYAAGLAVAGVALAGLAANALWSVAGPWAFPAALPQTLTTRTWQRTAPQLPDPLIETILVAAFAAFLSLAIVIACLNTETRRGKRPGGFGMLVLYLPLLVPQVSFLPGLQALALWGGMDGGRMAVVAAHMVFVLPYIYLSLSGPFSAWDTRYGTVAAALGARPWRVLLHVQLPMLLAPILTALAVGLAVSVAQYLPTLIIGGGRVQTITTEAVALAAGGDRRVIGLYTVVQTSLAALAFLAAVLVPRFVWANRMDMRAA